MILFKTAEPRRLPHRGREARERRVARDRHLGRRADRRRHRARRCARRSSQAYNRVENIMIPNMYYRKDIGDRWFEDSDRLHNWGYLRD